MGLTWDIKCRQSNPPIECARRLTPRPWAFPCSWRSKVSAREVMEPVLQVYLVRSHEVMEVKMSERLTCYAREASLPRDGCDDDFRLHFITEDVEHVQPVVHSHARKRRRATRIEAVKSLSLCQIEDHIIRITIGIPWQRTMG